jgi:hypothetical protein
MARASRDKKKAETAILRLKKALALCSGQNKRSLETDIEDAILRVKKLRFFLQKSEYAQSAAEKYKEIRVSLSGKN